MNKLEIVEDAFIVMGVALSVDQIKTILGVILLVLQICLILYKSIKAIINKVKNKDIDGAVKEVQDATEKIEDVIDKHGDREDKK